MINGMRYVAASILLVCAVMVRTPALADRVQSAAPKLEQLTPLSLHDSMNSFNGPDGPFSVFQTWRDNGNAWGYHLSDAPHTGENALATFQFAKGRLDGKPFVLLFEVIRDPGKHPVPSPAPTVIYVYSLTHSDGTPGWTPSYFHFVKKIPVPGTFFSSDTALKAATGLPLSADAGPPPSADGCLH